MTEPEMNLEWWRSTLIGSAGLMVVSSVAFYALSHLHEDTAGNTIGTWAIIGLTIWLISQIWVYATRIQSPHHQLLLMGVSFIQVVPFLFAAVYGSFGYYDLCIVGARNAADVLYFSYVTFTTVGFGDLHPTGICRGVAVAEAVTGYILLGLFVSAAVGIYSHRAQRRFKPD